VLCSLAVTTLLALSIKRVNLLPRLKPGGIATLVFLKASMPYGRIRLISAPRFSMASRNRMSVPQAEEE
jgi:hypothetical protein